MSKSYGPVDAVVDVSFEAAAGRVCGFLGPNGSGKTTTLRCLLGLTSPDTGAATIDGREYRATPRPATVVGAVIDPTAHHPDRSARNHLRVLQQAAGLPGDRVTAVLREVELLEAADRRIGTFSLGMRQRLHLAAALLGDPPTLVLDEPANGLDPGGMRWLRDFLREAARGGRCVLLSSHQLHEVATTVDDAVVIAGGRTVAAGALASILGDGERSLRIRARDTTELRAALVARGATVATREGALLVTGIPSSEAGRAAIETQTVLEELRVEEESLEERFFALTGEHG